MTTPVKLEGPRYPVTITDETLKALQVPKERREAFIAAVPAGRLNIDDVAAHVAALDGPLAAWERLLIDARILPRLITAGESCAVAGYRGMATAGLKGEAKAGLQGTAVADIGGTATAGIMGHAVAGHDGTAIAGDEGIALVSRYGRVSAGEGGVLVAQWWDATATRRRLAVAYVGEPAPGLPEGEVIRPYQPYRVDVVEGRAIWRHADQPRHEETPSPSEVREGLYATLTTDG